MFIGPKKVKEVNTTEEKTNGGLDILKITYTDGTIEFLSKKMYDAIVSKNSCDLTALRESRLNPVIQELLIVLREWGIKVNELPYISVLLTQSLDYNTKEALRQLWLGWAPWIKDVEEVDLMTVDRVLKASKKTLKDVL